MSETKIKPWFTEKYAKQLQEEHKLFMKAQSLTEETAVELIASTKEEGRKRREKQDALIKKIGVEAYVKNLVVQARELIKACENPTPDEKQKYTEDYFRDMIKVQTEFINNADKIIARLKTLTQEERQEVAHEIGRYLKLPQGMHTNHLARKLTTKINNPAQLDLNGKVSIIDKDFRLYIEGYDKLVNGANTSAVKFFDAAVITCSRTQDALARIPLKEYMELRGLKDEKEARKQIKADMEVLKAVKFEYRGTGKRRGDWLSINLYGGRAGIYKGMIEFRFTPEFYASIPENQFMFIPREYFSTKDRYNPHTAYFIRRIAEHKRMNLGKSNENIIGVETLVTASPTFPKYDDVNYRFTQFILEPFERDMDAITSIKWHYTDDQPKNYNEFITSSLIITWEDYPDVTRLTQKKEAVHQGEE